MNPALYNAVVMTDGSCGIHDDQGAWVAVVCDDMDAYLLHGTEYPSTNNRCELMPIIRGIQWTAEALVKPAKIYTDTDPYRILVLTDSEHVQRGYTEYHNVKSNPDLWAGLRHLPFGVKVDMVHVPRNSTGGNHLCDKFAGFMREKLIDLMSGCTDKVTPGEPLKNSYKHIRKIIPAGVHNQAKRFLKEGHHGKHSDNPSTDVPH